MNKKNVFVLLCSLLLLLIFVPQVNAEEKDVSTWQDFTEAIADEDTTIINLINDIKNENASSSIANASAGTLKKNLTINGVNGSKIIDFGDSGRIIGPGLTLDSTVDNQRKLELNNIEFKGNASGTTGQITASTRDTSALIHSGDQNGKWIIEFFNFKYNYGNNKRIVYAPTAEIVFDGGESILNNDFGRAPDSAAGQTSVGRDWHRLFEVKSFKLINGSKISADLVDMLFYSTISGTSSENGAQVIIDNGSVLDVKNKFTPIIAVDGAYFTFKVDGTNGQPSMLKAYSETRYRDRFGGAITVEGDNALYQVDNQSTLELTGRWSPVTVMMSRNGVFNVDNGSTFSAESLSDNGYTLGGTIRFRDRGDMTFNIKNESALIVKKQDINAAGNPATANRGAAIRMYGGGNNMNVSGGSKVEIENDSNESAIQYTAGGNNQFNLVDKNSKVKIISKRSRAIDAETNTINIVGESGTEFQLTADSDTVFNYGTGSNFEFNNMLYYDFTNTRKTGTRMVFAGRGTLKSINSDTSFWLNSANVMGNPTKAYTLIDYGREGNYLETATSTFTADLLPSLIGETFSSNQDVTSFLGITANRMRNMSRISGNNAYPIVDEIRTPTNADKYIFGHVSVPEGVEGLRNAWTDEVTVILKVTPKNGESYLVKGVTIGSDEINEGLSVYGEPARAGMFKIATPDGELLQTGDKIEAIEAWRGGAGGEENPDPSKVHSATPADDDRWVQEAVTTIDVTPPNPAIVNSTDRISPVSKEISGTGEVGSQVSFTVNGEAQPEWTTTVDGEGNWKTTIPAQVLQDGDKIQVFLRDTSGIASGVDNPPITNNEIGNINPAEDLNYHDTTFKAATVVTVNGTLELVSVPDEVNFGKLAINKYQTMLGADESKMDVGLKVADTRGNRTSWKIVATVEQEMESVVQKDVLENSFKYVYEGQEPINLTSEPKIVYEHDANDPTLEYDLTSSWGAASDKDGLKFHYTGNKTPVSDEAYRGVIKWTLQDTAE